jgi:hypothetical protein
MSNKPSFRHSTTCQARCGRKLGPPINGIRSLTHPATVPKQHIFNIRGGVPAGAIYIDRRSKWGNRSGSAPTAAATLSSQSTSADSRISTICCAHSMSCGAAIYFVFVYASGEDVIDLSPRLQESRLRNRHLRRAHLVWCTIQTEGCAGLVT